MSTILSTSTKTNKRKSDAGASGISTKKSKLSASTTDPHSSVKALVSAILTNQEGFDAGGDEASLRRSFVKLAEYARGLEAKVQSLLEAGAKAGPPPKSQAELEAEADRLANTINSGIRKQMSWKPSCKTGSAKFAFDGICVDPLVFGTLLRLDGPPKFKAKKIPTKDFEEMVGKVRGSVRYDTLTIKSSDVNIRYNADTGEFKVSGSYGRGY